MDINLLVKRIPDKVLIIMGLVALVLVHLGFGGFLYAASIATGASEPYKISQELGLSSVSGIAVHEKGIIFCGSQGYSRIHAYDLNGKFLYALRVPSGGGAFKLKIENGILKVATVRTNSIILYDVEGNLVSKIKDPDGYEIFRKVDDYNTKDREGNIYYIKSPELYPTIFKKSIDGSTTKIVSPKFKKWIVTGPLPAWFFAAGGLGLIMIILWAKEIFPIHTTK